jgi:transposase-like protein
MADEMFAQGTLHSDIARSLGISIMTYHRWRKARRELSRQRPQILAEANVPTRREQTSDVKELQLENSRLRRLVTDLLLEKLQLEERLGGGAPNSAF